MSLSKFESEVKFVQQPIEIVYERLSDLRNLQGIKEKLNNSEVSEGLSNTQIPQDKLETARQYLENMELEEDSISLSTPMGALKLCITERDPQKCIKFESEGSPIPLSVWVQVLPHGENETKLRVTVGAEVNFFMKGMVSKPLQQAANGLAELLSKIK